MKVVERKLEIFSEIKSLLKKKKLLEAELVELHKKDHRTSRCKHSINKVCYCCSYP